VAVTLSGSFAFPEPFQSPHFIFEPKLDGFRALAHVQRYRC
jgi:ATP-dependent DNA ligase